MVRKTGRRGLAATVAGALAFSIAGVGGAGALTSQSSISLTSLYNSNPYLVPSGARSAEALGVLANIPLTYTGNSQSFDFGSSLRFARTFGDTALLTDYQYLNADWHVDGERNGLTVNAAWHRDTTFYNVFENAALQGHSLPRLEYDGGIAWHHSLSELSELSLSGSYAQTDYSSESQLRFDNFNYAQVSLQWQRKLTELWNWDSSISYGHFDLHEQGSTNTNRSVQTSLTRALSERWSLMAQIGYSRVGSSQQAFFCCEIVPVTGGYVLKYIPVKVSSSDGVASYALNLARSSERWSADLSASRSVQPSALGGIFTQDSLVISASAPWNERLSVGASLRESRQSNPLRSAAGSDRFNALESHATWQWTEYWNLELAAGYTWQRIASQSQLSSGVSATLTLSRQFGLVTLH